MKKVNKKLNSSILFNQKRNFIKLQNSIKPSKLRIMTYNILAPSNIEKFLFPQHTSKSLNKELRYSLIIQEIKEIKPDILCIQELDEKDIIYFEKMSKDLLMKIIYKKKNTSDKFDGNAIFYKSDKFNLEKDFFIDCNLKKDKNYNKEDILSKELYYPTVALFAILSYKNDSKEKFIISTTHLPFNKNKGHVKLGILVLILKSLLNLKKEFKIENGFLVGDFNCIPNSMLYDYLIDFKINLKTHLCEFSNQKLAINLRFKALKTLRHITQSKFRPFKNFYEMKFIDRDFLKSLSTVLPVFKDREIFFQNGEQIFSDKDSEELLNCLVEENSLSSSYSDFYKEYYNRFNKNKRLEASLTHHARDLKVTVDYIFKFGNSFKVNQILKCPSIEYFQNLPRSLPIDYYGSDHLSLVADYE